MSIRYKCSKCGHDYGTRAPSPPAIMLHFQVSHRTGLIRIEVSK